MPSPLQTSQCVLGSLPPPPRLPGVGVEDVDAVEVDADGVGDGECKPLPLFNLVGRLEGGGAEEPGRGEEIWGGRVIGDAAWPSQLRSDPVVEVTAGGGEGAWGCAAE